MQKVEGSIPSNRCPRNDSQSPFPLLEGDAPELDTGRCTLRFASVHRERQRRVHPVAGAGAGSDAPTRNGGRSGLAGADAGFLTWCAP
jgi:hypothetical protein